MITLELGPEDAEIVHDALVMRSRALRERRDKTGAPPGALVFEVLNDEVRRIDVIASRLSGLAGGRPMKEAVTA